MNFNVYFQLTKKLIIQNYIPHTLAVAKTILLSIPGTDESSNLFVKYEPEERKWEGKIDTESKSRQTIKYNGNNKAGPYSAKRFGHNQNNTTVLQMIQTDLTEKFV